jgi:hypothetical protein
MHFLQTHARYLPTKKPKKWEHSARNSSNNKVLITKQSNSSPDV